MITPEQLLTDFTKDLVAHPGERQALIAGYAATMRARDAAIRRDSEVWFKGGDPSSIGDDTGQAPRTIEFVIDDKSAKQRKRAGLEEKR